MAFAVPTQAPRIFRADDAPPQPWRNGGGVTRELLVWPDASDWRVRISVADIGVDGAFSSFAGVRRWFAVLQGAGVALTIDGVERQQRIGDEPIAFPGDAVTTCRLLDGPTRDLNLMLRGAEGAMARVIDRSQWHPRAPRCGLFTRVAGRCHADGQNVDLPEHALLWFGHAPDVLVFASDAAPDDVPGWWLAADAATEAVP